jgi:hypothetical protein
VGVKITGLRDYVLLRLRQREIKANLELLASMFVEASSVSWAAGVEHDKQQRKQRLERMRRAPPSSAAEGEAGLIDRGLQLLAMRQSGEGGGAALLAARATALNAQCAIDGSGQLAGQARDV